MPKIMSLGNCTCEGWLGYAQDLSDRIVNGIHLSGTDDGVYEGPMFDFCPYCGKKLVRAGVGHKSIGTWRGKPLQEFDNQGLIEIVQIMGENLHKLREDLSEMLEAMGHGLGGS